MKIQTLNNNPSMEKQYSSAENFEDGNSHFSGYPIFIEVKKDSKYLSKSKVIVADKNGFYVEFFIEDTPCESYQLNLDFMTLRLAKKLIKGYSKLNKRELLLMGWDQIN